MGQIHQYENFFDAGPVFIKQNNKIVQFCDDMTINNLWFPYIGRCLCEASFVLDNPEQSN
jgi:hypothetical protein